MKRSLLTAPLAAAVALACAPPVSHAQQLEEMIVTAQKRAESLQDVPISVTAMHGEKLQDAGIPNMAALADYVPNLHIASASVNTNIYMRGIGSGNNQAFEQSVGMYIDGIYMGRGRQYRAGFLDVERVEVLRGPQGTLFGKNTVAGAVNITSRSAEPGEEFNGEIAASLESHDGQIYEGYLSGSLTDTLGARVAFKYRETDGYVENTFLNEDEGQTEEASYRISLSWIPTDNLSVGFKYTNTDFERTGAPSATQLYLDPVSRAELFPNLGTFGQLGYLLTDVFYPEINEESKKDFTTYKDNGYGQSQSDGIGIGKYPDSNDEEFNTYGLHIDYDFAGLTLTSITGYTDYEYKDGVDVDWLPLQFIHRDDDQEFDQVSQEFRITSPGGEFFDYVAGAYYESSELSFDRRVTVDVNIDGLVPALLGIPSALLIATQGLYGPEQFGRNHIYELDSDSWAVFAQGTFNLSDTLRVTLGLRYTEEEKEVQSDQFLSDTITGIGEPSNSYFNAAVQAGEFNNYAYNYQDDRETDKWIPSVNVQWDVGADTMLYASFSQGFKSGGFTSADDGEPGGVVQGTLPCGPNPDLTVDIENCYDPSVPNDDFEFDDETVDAFEIGGKHTLLDGGMTLNWAAFYTKYDDLQTSIFKGVGFQVKNAASSEVYGIEVDALWQTTENLRLGGNFAWLDATYDDFRDGPCTAIQLDIDEFCGSDLGTTSNDLSGEPTTYASDYSAALFADYIYPFSNSVELFFGADLNYRDEFFSSGDNDPLDLVDSYTKVNMRVGARGEQWEIMFYGRNIFDEANLAQGFDTPVLEGSHSYFMEEGEIWGGRLKYSF